MKTSLCKVHLRMFQDCLDGPQLKSGLLESAVHGHWVCLNLLPRLDARSQVPQAGVGQMAWDLPATHASRCPDDFLQAAHLHRPLSA